LPGATPSRLVAVHALGKALNAVIPRSPGNPETLILGADTIVYRMGRIYGKPGSMDEARQFLNELAGKTHWVYSGIALVSPDKKRGLVAVDRTAVKLKDMPPDRLENYLKRIHPLDKAGAYAIQRHPNIVARWKGSWTNVVGLGLEKLNALRGRARRRLPPLERNRYFIQL
jgi:septum formation protein